MHVIREPWLQRRQCPLRWIFLVELHLRAYAGVLQHAKVARGMLYAIRRMQAC